MKNMVEVYKQRAEMLDSYLIAIAKAGGSTSRFVDNIETMTVMEMIECLAHNGVRFTNKRRGDL